MHKIINPVFYTLKPFIPRQVQIALRRRIARYKLRKYSDVWPIDPNAARPPAGWPGWPDGKQFALVLSHDVDTLRGYNNVLKLAEIEENLGFRSVFNFVPERYGEISLELLDELRERGFGVGVHGLKHDGKLFFSRKIFDRKAFRINAYLKKWKTRGFTSPSMHHNLEWLTELDIDYSISTFDTDPFEPQPEPVATIFPFWVADGSPDNGYLELPHTLPQDSTLFVILQEKTIDIWKRKLNWIAEQGGMVLVNAHPDYMEFQNSRQCDQKYPAKYYIDFLKYISEQYRESYFHTKPSDIVIMLKNSKTSKSRNSFKVSNTIDLIKAKNPNSANNSSNPITHKPINVCMLTYSFYESDNRVRRYAETLVGRGDSVDVISLRREGQTEYNILNGVRIFRVQERVRNERGKLNYLLRILKFWSRSAFTLTRKHLLRHYDLIHVHSVPDFEVFAAIVPKLTGSKIILDIHDIVPELYSNKFRVNKKSVIFKLLVFIEKISSSFADQVIISNHLWEKRICSRSVKNNKCTTILNYPDENLFLKFEYKKNNDKIVFLYPGTLNHHQGLDLAINAFGKITDQIPNSELHIIGDGPEKKLLEYLVKELDLVGRVIFKDPVSLDAIPEIMSTADIGIIPKRNDDFGGEAFSTKSLEFMSLGKPIIISRTAIDQCYFNDSIVRFFEAENIDDLADAMLDLSQNAEKRDELSARALDFAKLNRWGIKKNIYTNLIAQLHQ